MAADDDEIPEEVKQAFTKVVLRVERRRKINLLGTLIALVEMLVGLPLGLAYMGMGPPGEFRGWILLVPLSLVGLTLWLFGKWARRV
jgi:hypothetical protein